jgi:formylglycine-generating enzyme required for sulfatase activity
MAAAGDSRPGVGLREDGLPDIAWGRDVPPGSYIIGGDEEAYSPLPEQQYQIQHAYQLARYPVTYQQFQAFLDAPDGFGQDKWWEGLTGAYQKQPMNEQRFKYTNHPRDSVSWYQAVAFCRWLTAKYREAGLLPDGQEIRLPTEQEWEVAARYPDGRRYPWGDTYVPGYANMDETDPYDPVGPYWLRQTTAVGLYPLGRQPELELDDLSGNVFEWCRNEYSDPEQTQIGGDKSRVLRGGSWSHGVSLARCASRLGNSPRYGNGGYGFRVVWGAPIS